MMTLIKALRQKVSKAYRIGFCIGLFALSALSVSVPLQANYCNRHRSDALELGLRLETEYWTLVQNHDVKGFSKKLASIFQGLNILGIYTRDQQISGLAASTMTSFSINNPVATRSNDVLVFSYDFIAVDSNLTSGPSITIWKKYGHSWKIVSHSYVPFVP